MRTIGLLLQVLFLCGLTYGQGAPLEFEAASLKLSPPPASPFEGRFAGCGGGPGTSQPGLYRCTNATLFLMASQAFGLKSYQIAPASSTDAQFNLEAKVPPGATAEQVKLMLQSLLTARFHLRYHYQQKEMQVLDLTVAKSGLKMKESSPQPDGESPPLKPVRHPDGFEYTPTPHSQQVIRAHGLIYVVASSSRLGPLISYLNHQLGQPVTDSTGLAGRYDFILTFAPQAPAVVAAATGAPPPETEGGLTVFAALERQLGLKLEAKKAPVGIFVIDHAEKMPLGN